MRKESVLSTSKRSLIIYFQFLVLPFLVSLAWVFIPKIEFYSWAVASGLYFLYVFLIWQVKSIITTLTHTQHTTAAAL